jgi:hypothetical protein
MTKMMQIVNKLGWNDMPADVALGAVQRMINNRHNVIADCCDESLCSDTIMEDMLSDEVTADSLWLDLFIDSYEELCNKTMQDYAASLKWEITSLMMSGVCFDDARKEWDI